MDREKEEREVEPEHERLPRIEKKEELRKPEVGDRESRTPPRERPDRGERSSESS